MTIKTHETNFIVMPKDCNWMDEGKLIFGGKMLAEMDLCAAGLIKKVLRSSPCDSAVTVGVNDVSFIRGARAGDLVVLKATLWNTGKELNKSKSIDIKIEGWIDSNEGMLKKCEGMFSWVARKNGEFSYHELPKFRDGKLVENS